METLILRGCGAENEFAREVALRSEHVLLLEHYAATFLALLLRAMEDAMLLGNRLSSSEESSGSQLGKAQGGGFIVVASSSDIGSQSSQPSSSSHRNTSLNRPHSPGYSRESFYTALDSGPEDIQEGEGDGNQPPSDDPAATADMPPGRWVWIIRSLLILLVALLWSIAGLIVSIVKPDKCKLCGEINLLYKKLPDIVVDALFAISVVLSFFLWIFTPIRIRVFLKYTIQLSFGLLAYFISSPCKICCSDVFSLLIATVLSISILPILKLLMVLENFGMVNIVFGLGLPLLGKFVEDKPLYGFPYLGLYAVLILIVKMVVAEYQVVMDSISNTYQSIIDFFHNVWGWFNVRFQMVRGWFNVRFQMVRGWFNVGFQMVRGWFNVGYQMVRGWFDVGFQMVRGWFNVGFQQARGWFSPNNNNDQIV